MITQQVHIKSKNQMINLADDLAKNLHVGDVVLLRGTLGVGKSFFAKHLISALSGKDVTVLSPTFNLVYSYQLSDGEIFHFDLYRLKQAEELENIGFFDALKNGICLIEWPEIAQQFLPKNYYEVEISMPQQAFITADSEEREVIIKKIQQ